MKKKFLSLLLSVALIVTTVSIGFSGIVANAFGAEDIATFRLEDTKIYTCGANFTTQIKIKNTISGYKVVVRSITATLPNLQKTATVTYTSGTEVTSEWIFSVSGSLSAGQADVIRYTCNYDVYTTAGALVYANLTGYGYGFASYSEAISGGELGTLYGSPPAPDNHSFSSWGGLRSIYVNSYPGSLSATCKTDMWHSGYSYPIAVYSGTFPTTASITSPLNFPSTSSSSSSKSSTYTWWGMTEPTSGYYNFTLIFDNKTENLQTVSIFYRVSTDAVNANNAVTNSLANCLQKKYYTESSWNNYLAALDAAAYAGRAVSGPTDSYRIACQNVKNAPTNLQSMVNALVVGSADYTAYNTAVAAFNAKANLTTPVTTYNPNGATGTTTMYVYNQTDVQALRDYIAAISTSYLANQQDQLDAYVTEIIARTNSLPYNNAEYTHLNASIADLANYDSEGYSSASWSTYLNAVIGANQISRSLMANEQATVNAGVSQVTTARMALVFLPADTAELLAQIAVAEQIIQEQLQNVPDDRWNEFQSAYNAALALSNANVTQQTAVNSAATRLKNANLSLAEYRAIDVTPLADILVTAKEYATEENRVHYTSGSFGILSAAIAEGDAFISAYNLGTKNYSDYDEMQQIITHIQTGISGLEKVLADYTQLFATLETVPDADVLALYVDSVANNITTIIGSINYDLKYDQQDQVDEINTNLQSALAQLTEDNYKGADYSGVNDAIAQAAALNRDYYTNFDSVDAAIAAVDWSKKIVDQADVITMADTILTAIANLNEKTADYTAVDAAIARIDNLEYSPSFYYNYSDVEEAIAAVDRDKKISQQADVDKMAADINTAIDSLGLADANYSPVENAISSIATLGNLDDYTEASLEALDALVAEASTVYNYKINQQNVVDDMAQAILDQIASMVLLPADFSAMETAFEVVDLLTDYRDNYVSLAELDAAVAAANAMFNQKNIREQDDVDAAVAKIYEERDKLILKSADYDALNTAVTNAQDLLETPLYPYTDESRNAVLAAIAAIDYTKKITEQSEVDAMLAELQSKVAALQYVSADYSAVDNAVAVANQKISAFEQNQLYTETSINNLKTAIQNINRTYRADNQAAVNAIAQNINEKIAALVYAPADYDGVTVVLNDYNELVRDYYNQADLADVDAAVAAVVFGYTRERQADVDTMATNITNALTALYPKMKPAVMTSLNNAVAQANQKRTDMLAQGYLLDPVTTDPLDTFLFQASTYSDPRINLQAEIDQLTQDIITATNNLKFLFTILPETTAIMDDASNIVYGFAEGTSSDNVIANYFKFIGNGNVVVKDEPYGNGFGTGSVIQFLNGSGEIIKEYTVVIFGDVNGDGYVDVFDAGYIVSAANMEVELTGAILKAGDVNQDGVIDAYDVTSMISLANMETTISQTGDNVVTPLN